MTRIVQFVFMAAMLICSAAPMCPGQETGTVYFYRVDRHGSWLPAFCDEMKPARVKQFQYVALHLAPGPHTCQSGDKQSGVVLDVKAGEEYYIKLSYEGLGLTGKSSGRVILMEKAVGASEIKGLKPMK